MQALADHGVRELLEVLARCGSPLGAWLLEHGRGFPYAAGLPDGVERGRYKDCYENAAMNVLRPGAGIVGGPPPASGYEYAEGYAWCGTMPVQHAWLVGPDGEAVDPTWVHDETCGFCLGDGEREGECVCEVDPEDVECGIDCYGCEREPLPCRFCGGSGEAEPRDTSEREYLGVVVPADVLRRSVLTRKVWGTLDDDEVRAALAK